MIDATFAELGAATSTQQACRLLGDALPAASTAGARAGAAAASAASAVDDAARPPRP